MADVKPLKVGSDGLIAQFEAGDTIAATIAPGGGGGGVIRPTTFSSHQSDYAPTGFSGASLVLLTSSGIYQITGLSASGMSDGSVKTLVNAGSNLIFLPVEGASSTAANRFVGSGSHFLFPGQQVSVVYDATDSRWRFLGSYDPEKVNGPHFEMRVASQTAGDWGDITFTTSAGIITTAVATTGLPGSYVVDTSVFNFGLAAMTLGKSVFPNFAMTSQRPWVINSFVGTGANLSDGSETYCLFMRITQVATSNHVAPNQIGLRYQHDINGGNWQLYCVDGSSTLTVIDTGVAVAASRQYRLRVEMDATGGIFMAYINDVYVGQIAPGTPPNLGGIVQAGIVKSVGTTLRNAHIFKLTGHQQF